MSTPTPVGHHSGIHVSTTISRGIEALRAGLDAALAVAKSDSPSATPFGWVDDPDWGFVVVFDGYQNYPLLRASVTIHQLWAVGSVYSLATRAQKWLDDLTPETWERFAGPELRVDGGSYHGFALNYLVSYENQRYGMQTVTINPAWIFVSK